MLKIKNSLLNERDKMAAVEQRKTQREAKLFMKQTRAKVIQDRQANKKNDLEEIKRWKKDRKHDDSVGGGGGGKDDDDLPTVLGKRKNNVEGDGVGGPSNNGSGPNKRNINHKRIHKDSKYGSGGKKRLRLAAAAPVLVAVSVKDTAGAALAGASPGTSAEYA